MNPVLHFDIVIIGGGVAGLWTLNRLRQQGYNAVLFEKNALGSGQTIASQGIIHGGIKYALSGDISESSRQISEMPARWQNCFLSQGEIDLSQVKTLSEHYYLCSQQKITQKITQFFAQKALHSDNEALTRQDYPDFFQNPKFSGLLTQVHERVLDVPTLIKALSNHMMPYIFKVSDIRLEKNDHVYSVQVKNDQQDTLMIAAEQIILTAGEGNAGLFAEEMAISPSLRAQRSNPGFDAQLDIEPGLPRCARNDGKAIMQTRPLRMVLLAADNLPRIFVHCVQLSTNPVLTITSHTGKDGKTVWYLGGQLAEDGATKDAASLIADAQALVQQQFPWFTIINPQWHTLYINRAEGFNAGKRPESVMVNKQDNVILAWPTKLTFAPLLADKILQRLPAAKNQQEIPAALATWSKPAIAQTPWEKLC